MNTQADNLENEIHLEILLNGMHTTLPTGGHLKQYS